MMSWKKIKSFVNSEVYSKVLILYMFIVGGILLVIAETKLGYVLAIFDCFLSFLALYILILVNRSKKSSQRILNYIDIYSTLPKDVIIKKEEKIYKANKSFVQKKYNCLFNKHDVIVYCVINPDTALTKYFEEHIETLNFSFFKDKFLAIDESDLYIFKKQYIRK